jgi:hypothetical protein
MRLLLRFFAAALAASPAAAWADPPESASPLPGASSLPGASVDGGVAPSAAAASLTVGAGAEADAPSSPGDRPAPGFGIDVRAGMRLGWLTSQGYDPFSGNNVLSQVSFSATYALARSGPLSLHAGAFYDVGTASDSVRGASSRLRVHRPALGVEARYKLRPWLLPYARVAPGALRLDARVDDRGGGGTLESGQWTWSLDAAAGAALAFPFGGRETSRVGVVIFAEGGYGLAGSVSMAMRPEGGGEGARVGEV